jgi:hypothetical protein
MASNQLDPFRLISQYFWLVCLAISLINYIGARRRIGTQNGGPLNVDDAIRYVRWFALAGALPWALMGIGQLSGATPTIWYYFRPQDLNPFVLAWFACIFAVTIAYAVWVLFMDGASKVRQFGLMSAFGMPTNKPMSERLIKITAAVGPPFLLVWILLAVSSNMPLPK